MDRLNSDETQEKKHGKEKRKKVMDKWNSDVIRELELVIGEERDEWNMRPQRDWYAKRDQ